MSEILNCIPKDRKERIKLLDETIATLKSEFVGLDRIIDEIKDSISPWYITPELIERPVIISLWGMTGTGKTSVVNRLTELLGIAGRVIGFDCGDNLEDSKITDKLCRSFGLEEGEGDSIVSIGSADRVVDDTENTTKHAVFIFDEFQYARTINEVGEEVDKKDLRPIWNIVDNGIIDIKGWYSYNFNRLMSFIDDFTSLSEITPDMEIVNGKTKNKADTKKLLEEIGYWYERNIPNITVDSSEYSEDRPKGEKDQLRPLEVIPFDQLKTIRARLNRYKKCMGSDTVKKFQTEKYTVLSLSKELRKIKNILTLPKKINCSGSLVFIIGNLDEAFKMAGDINPDIDADMFYDITSRVTISDIKKSLYKRFRAEQIARLGNNIIKYPTLTRESFLKVIDKEVGRIITAFEKIEGIKVTISEAIREMLYYEGVFPTQGVRPVFTTIESMLTPYLSKIILDKGEEDTEVLVDIKNQDDWKKWSFKIPETTITLKFDKTGKVSEYNHRLQLGTDRSPQSRKTRYICSVHEAGHAITHAYTTGVAPLEIVSVSTDRGGFCITYNKDKEGEIPSRHDIDTEVIISFGGYAAENLIYNRAEMRLLGSGSDLDSAWDTLSGNSMWCGYFRPISMGSRRTQAGTSVPDGLEMESTIVNYFDGTEFTDEKMSLNEAIERRLSDLYKESEEILKKEDKLLRVLAKYLGEYGSMKGDLFMKFVESYGVVLNSDFMKEQKNKYSEDYYENSL